VSHVLATYNIKGGVGKTSAAANLAFHAAREGNRTLIWDLDPQGASTFLFRVRPKVRGGARKLVQGRTDPADSVKGTDHEGLDLLPADFRYRHMDLALDGAKRPTERLTKVIGALRGEYDYIFLDCPPSISLVSENVFDAADTLLVPLIPATLSARTLDQLMGVVAGDARVLVFFSMVDGRKRLHREVMERLRRERHEVLETAIPAAADVERMGEQRAVLADFAPRGRAATAYAALWQEIRGRIAG
jgi:cellulose biosynthesis protein BcsQ